LSVALLLCDGFEERAEKMRTTATTTNGASDSEEDRAFRTALAGMLRDSDR
jgi:hypothetical protein